MAIVVNRNGKKMHGTDTSFITDVTELARVYLLTNQGPSSNNTVSSNNIMLGAVITLHQ